MAKGGKLIVKDEGWDEIVRRNKALMKAEVHAIVGVQGEKGKEIREEGMTNAYLASIHEFGTKDGRIPSRSFFRSTFDDKLASYQREILKMGKIFLSGQRFPGGGTIEGQLMLLGEKYRVDIYKKIYSKIPPTLKPSTIRARAPKTEKARASKGNKGKIDVAKLADTPLYNTGTMVAAISVVMEHGKHSSNE